MVERPGRPGVVSEPSDGVSSGSISVAGVFCAALADARDGEPLELDEDAAHHIRVRRLALGDPLRVADGVGRIAFGTLVSTDRRGARMLVDRVDQHPRVAGVRLLVPVADRDRMLWLAEKAVELGVGAWQPVTWERSRSVAGRGEGAGFAAKVRARMSAALVQCGGAWLPEIAAERSCSSVLATLEDGDRVVLDQAGDPLARQPVRAPVTIALGPEGGFVPAERDMLAALQRGSTS